MTWSVRKTYYLSYSESEALGPKPPELVKAGLPFWAANQMVERLGFGYSMHPER